MAPCFKRLTSELGISLTTDALRELERGHTETNKGVFNKLATLKLLTIETEDTVDSIFGVLLSDYVIEKVSLRGKERLSECVFGGGGGRRDQVTVKPAKTHKKGYFFVRKHSLEIAALFVRVQPPDTETNIGHS